MKNVYLAIAVLLGFLGNVHSQKTTDRQGATIPSFKILLTNGSYYTSDNIDKSKPFVLIYFAPDCDHCTVLMDGLFKKVRQLDNTSVVMVTFKPPQELVAFEKKYNTYKYPNIKVGTEGYTYWLRNYYKLDKTPFVAVYNKKGALAFSYRNEPPVDEMLARVKKL